MMKISALLCACPVAVAMSLSLAAQVPVQSSQPPAEVQTASALAVPVPSTANSPEIANPDLRPVTAELVSRLDAKSAKTGDSVVVKTTEKATTANGIDIPKGSKIMGRVTDVELKGGDGNDSRIAIQFDRAQLRDGQTLPIRSVIQSVAPAGAMPEAEKAGAPAPPASTSAAGMASRPQAAPGSPVPTEASAAATASQGNQPAGTVVAKNGNVAIRTTSVPGVLLASNMNGQPFPNASGALLGAQQDVHLDGGTRMTLAIATTPVGNAR